MNLRNLTPATKAQMLADLDNQRALIASLPVATPCANCVHFSAKDAWCQTWKTTVPAAAQTKGCDRWEEGVPF